MKRFTASPVKGETVVKPTGWNAIERALGDALKKDKARYRVSKMSEFGIVEMTRQRMRPPLNLMTLSRTDKDLKRLMDLATLMHGKHYRR